MNKILNWLTASQHFFIQLLKVSIFIVMVWIGGLKVFPYEAEGIVPFVANSPLMSFFYNNDASHYKAYKNKEGEYVQKNIEWHEANGTYLFSYGLGFVILMIGAAVLCGIFYPKAAVLGGLLTFLMSLVTLSFLVTTPEVYVADLGAPTHGFPYLSGAGRLVIKDIIMMAAGLSIASDGAGNLLKRKALLLGKP